MEKGKEEKIHVHYKANIRPKNREEKENLERHAESCIITTQFQSPCSLSLPLCNSSHEAKGKKLKCITENKKTKQSEKQVEPLASRLIEMSPKLTARRNPSDNSNMRTTVHVEERWCTCLHVLQDGGEGKLGGPCSDIRCWASAGPAFFHELISNTKLLPL